MVSNPWIGFFGTVVGVVGLVLSVFFYYKSVKVKRPTVRSVSLNWFDGSHIPHKDLELKFRGISATRFTITHIAFWNAGTDPIRPSDFSASSPLRISYPLEMQVFDIHISAVTSPELAVSIEPPKQRGSEPILERAISFAYFDRNDGFSIQVVHDGLPEQTIEIVGKLPGAPPFKRESTNRRARSFIRRKELPPLAKTSWLEVLYIGLFALSIGIPGVVAIYYAIFIEFHWFLVPASLSAVWVVVAGIVLLAIPSDLAPPKGLVGESDS